MFNESSLSRVYKQSLEFDTGTITAYRSANDCNEGKPFFRKDNQKRNKILSSKLLKMGYGITKVKGSYIENYKSANAKEVSEESFLVVDLKARGTLKKDLISLGSEFEQDSITYAPAGNTDYYLISSNTCPEGYPGFGKIGKEVKLGKPQFSKDGEFFSRVNGRPFVFENINEDYVSKTITDFYPTEIRSITEFAKMTPKQFSILEKEGNFKKFF